MNVVPPADTLVLGDPLPAIAFTTVSVSPSTSVSVPAGTAPDRITPLAAVTVSVPWSSTLPVSLAATGASLTGVTVMASVELFVSEPSLVV